MKTKALNPSAQDLKINGKSNFQLFFFDDQNAPKKIYKRNMDLLISKLLSKSIFGLKILKYIFAYFQFDHFPKSKIDFESSFEIRRSIFIL